MDINTNKNKDNAAQNATVELALSLKAFYEKVASLTAVGKMGWTGDDQTALIADLLPELKTPDGKSAVFNRAQVNVLQLIFRPTESAQRTVLNQICAEAGYVLNSEAEGLLMLLFATGQFGKFLAENSNPATGVPFIAKSKKKNAKKNAFQSMLKSAVVLPVNGAPFVTPPIIDAAEVVSEPAAPQQTEAAAK